MAGYQIFDKTKVYNINYLGLAFARFKILSLVKSEGKLHATIEIYNDEFGGPEKKNYLDNIKKELKLYYDCKLKNIEADMAKEKLDSETSINKIIFKAIDEL